MKIKRTFTAIVICLSSVLVGVYATQPIDASDKFTSKAITTDETARCLNCHASRQPKLVETWSKSTHGANRVGCFECHGRETIDSSVIPGHFGFKVSLLVTPKTCGSCHEEEYESFKGSAHANAYQTIKDDSIRKQSPMVFEASCAACHGNEPRFKRGRALDETWPNHGIGRINPDGSKGSCVACHGHHEDSLENARSADTCAKCHARPEMNAIEAWTHSKHGSNWQKAAANADLSKKNFVPINEEIYKPNCYVCHFAPTKEGEKATHNPSERLSWNLGPANATYRENWGEGRLKMQETCRTCHASTQVEHFYRRLDAVVVETNKAIDAAASLPAAEKELKKQKANQIRLNTAKTRPLQ
jgi:hydroxylamine dehydrogenase